MRNNSPAGVEKKGATQEIAEEQLKLERSNPIEGVPGRNCGRATEERSEILEPSCRSANEV